MKKTLFSIFFIIGIVSIVLIFGIVLMRGRQNTVIHDSPQWHLPEGVKARLGKGSINDMVYSPDGTVLAVASSIGVWLYDVASGQARTLLTADASSVSSVSFSPDGRTLASGSGGHGHSVGCRDWRTQADLHRGGVCL